MFHFGRQLENFSGGSGRFVCAIGLIHEFVLWYCLSAICPAVKMPCRFSGSRLTYDILASCYNHSSRLSAHVSRRQGRLSAPLPFPQ